MQGVLRRVPVRRRRIRWERLQRPAVRRQGPQGGIQADVPRDPSHLRWSRSKNCAFALLLASSACLLRGILFTDPLYCTCPAPGLLAATDRRGSKGFDRARCDAIRVLSGLPDHVR